MSGNLKNIIISLLAIFIMPQSVLAVDFASTFQFEAYLTDTADNPIGSYSSIVFEIRNPAGNCVLFKESHAGGSTDNGSISLMVGTGTRDTVADGGNSWATIFSNEKAISGVGGCGTYTPVAGHGRKLYVTVDGVALSPAFDISPVPMAGVAQQAQSVDGSAFIRNGNALSLEDGVGNFISVKAPTSVPANYNFVLPSSAGAANQILQTDGAGNLSWVTNSASVAANSILSSHIQDGTIVSADMADAAVSYAKIQDASAGNVLLGAEVAGDFQEISIGSGLSLSAGILSASNSASVVGSALNSGNIWVGDGANTAQPVVISGDASMGNTGVMTINNSAVSYAKIQNVTDNRILGRSAGAAGVVQELTVGTGLSLSAGVLSATGTADNLGNHTAASNIILGANYLSNDGTANGLSLDASGNANFTANVYAQSGSLRDLALYDADQSNYVHLSAPATVATNFSLFLPAADGTNGQVLQTDGAGQLSWVTPPSGSNGITSLSGDLTASGPGAVVATISPSAITSAKIADGSIGGIDIASGAITLAHLQNATTAGKLLGSDAASMPYKEISLNASDFNIDASGVLNFIGGGGGSVNSVTASAPIAIGGTATDPIVSITQAASGSSGFLSSADWSYFNSKLNNSVSNSNKILGRRTAGAGPVEELGLDPSTLTIDGSGNLSVIGGASGAIGLDSLGCSFDQVPYYNGSSWSCMVANSSNIGNSIAKRDASGNVFFGSAELNDLKVINSIKLGDGITSHGIDLRSPAGSSYFSLTLPTYAGNLGEVLSSDGSGNLVWFNPSASGPSGAINSVMAAASSPLSASSDASGNVTLDMNFIGVAGTYGGGSQNVSFSVDNYGRVTGVSQVPIDHLQGYYVTPSPTANDFLMFDGTNWITSPVSVPFMLAGQIAEFGTSDFNEIQLKTNNLIRFRVTPNGLAELVPISGGLPAGVGGSLAYDGDTNELKWHDGAMWHSVKSDNIALATGTAATPSLHFSNNVNTGFYSPSPGQISITDGSADAFFFDTNNKKLGINTNTPAVTLDVGGLIKAGNDISACGTGLYGAIKFDGSELSYCDPFSASWKSLSSPSRVVAEDSTATNPSIQFQSNSSSGLYFDGATIGLSANGSPALIVNPVNRRIAMGPPALTAPAAKLHIHEPNLNNAFLVETGGSPMTALVVDSSGFVGIGTNTPAANLDISGNMQVQGPADFNGQVQVNNMININQLAKLQPLLSPPLCDASARGSIAFSDSANAPCFCDGTNWMIMMGGGGGSACTGW